MSPYATTARRPLQLWCNFAPVINPHDEPTPEEREAARVRMCPCGMRTVVGRGYHGSGCCSATCCEIKRAGERMQAVR